MTQMGDMREIFKPHHKTTVLGVHLFITLSYLNNAYEGLDQ